MSVHNNGPYKLSQHDALFTHAHVTVAVFRRCAALDTASGHTARAHLHRTPLQRLHHRVGPQLGVRTPGLRWWGELRVVVAGKEVLRALRGANGSAWPQV